MVCRVQRLPALTVVLALAACDSAAERKAQEEAAINAGASVAVQASGPAAKAAAIEVAAAASDSSLLTSLPPPSDRTSQPRSEIASVVDGIECPPEASAEHCAQFKASLAQDMHGMLDDQIEACVGTRARIEDAQRQLAARSTDLEADLDALSRDITSASEWYKSNCAQ